MESTAKTPDMVNHPSHYQKNGLEVIDMIKACTEGLEGIQATDTGNVLKYLARWHDKNGLEDLKKAQWYLNHLIDQVEQERLDTMVQFSFGSGDDAEAALEEMRSVHERFGCVSVSDLQSIRKVKHSLADNAIGWKSLDDFYIQMDDNDLGAILYLPKPVTLSDKADADHDACDRHNVASMEEAEQIIFAFRCLAELNDHVSVHDSPGYRRAQTGHVYDDIIFDTRDEAESVLEQMGKMIDVYRVVSVGDLYDMAGITGNYTDLKYGWTDIQSASVVRARDGYIIKLPKPRLL